MAASPVIASARPSASSLVGQPCPGVPDSRVRAESKEEDLAPGEQSIRRSETCCRQGERCHVCFPKFQSSRSCMGDDSQSAAARDGFGSMPCRQRQSLSISSIGQPSSHFG